MGGSLSLYLAATPVVSRRRYSSSFVSPSRYLRPRLQHEPKFLVELPQKLKKAYIKSLEAVPPELDVLIPTV